MTIDITSPAIIDRQVAMRDLGMTAALIDQLMRASDDTLRVTVEKGRARAAVQTGEQQQHSLNMIRAIEIEAQQFRGFTI